MGLKRLPLKLIKNFADIICVLPSPAGPYLEMLFGDIYTYIENTM